MKRRNSTTALTAEQHAAQDERYKEGHEYDYIIVGTGHSALVAGALLANAGKKVCMLERHDIPGGYAQNFKRGEYYFNAQVHYIWGAGEGGKLHAYLKKLGLDKEITFEVYDPEGYDHMVMPDGKRVKIPYGWDKLVDNVTEAYPGDKEAMEKFVDIINRIREQLYEAPPAGSPIWEYVKRAHKFPAVVKYRNKTVQDVFDECGLSIEAQTVLAANMGDYMSPPNELSFMLYIALFAGYNSGTYYPTKHFKFYIERLAQFITDQEGCHIYYETMVTKVNHKGGKVTSVETENGKVFSADRFIWNGDPQLAASKIGWDHFSRKQKKKLQYEYSPSGIVIYLGLKDIDLTEYGFGKFNIWHWEDWDVNKVFEAQKKGDFTKPWFFISTPTLHSDAPGTTPEGRHIMEIATHTDYAMYKAMADQDKKAYAKAKKELAERMLDLVEERYIPNLRDHIEMKVVGMSTTNEDYVGVPKGSAYGSAMIPSQVGLNRLEATDNPWDNFYWCNATGGYAGVYGTGLTGIKMYMQLTGDDVYDHYDLPSDEVLIERAIEQYNRDNA